MEMKGQKAVGIAVSEIDLGNGYIPRLQNEWPNRDSEWSGLRHEIGIDPFGG